VWFQGSGSYSGSAAIRTMVFSHPFKEVPRESNLLLGVQEVQHIVLELLLDAEHEGLEYHYHMVHRRGTQTVCCGFRILRELALSDLNLFCELLHLHCRGVDIALHLDGLHVLRSFVQEA